MPSAAERNNVRIRGRVDGRPIVFAHGFGCDQNMWRFMVPEFEDDYRVVTFDHVGFGRSDLTAWNPDRHRALGGYADDLIELLAELDLTDTVFVGHSVASMIGVLAALAEPQRFGDLILVGPSPRYIDDAPNGYRGGFSEHDIAELLAALESNYFGWSSAMAPVIMGTPERPDLGEELRDSFCRTDPKVAAAFARATFLSDNRADLAQVNVPALVLQCRADPIAPDEVGRYVADQIPDSVLVHLQATGHCPNLSAPAETTAAIKTYLRDRVSASA